MKNNPWIVCAAIQHIDTKHIICSARHYDMLMHKQKKVYDDSRGFKQNPSKWEQGFVDQFCTFYNRVQAMAVVRRSGQPFNKDRNSGSGKELYSEGLY